MNSEKLKNNIINAKLAKRTAKKQLREANRVLREAKKSLRIYKRSAKAAVKLQKKTEFVDAMLKDLEKSAKISVGQ